MSDWRSLLQARGSEIPYPYWQSLHYYNLYRLTLSSVFVLSFVLFGPTLTFGAHDPSLFFLTSIIYLLTACLSILSISYRWPPFAIQLNLHIATDIVLITGLIYASGGLSSGLGVLPVIALAAVGLVGQGRTSLFQAALASVAVLAEETYQVVQGAHGTGIFQAAFFSLGFFATAAVAQVLAGRLVESEKAAEEKSIDLANLAQVNQLIIQDMDAGVLVVDEHGDVRQHNLQAERLLGVVPPTEDVRVEDFSRILAERLRRWQSDPEKVSDTLRVRGTGRQVRARFVALGGAHGLGALIFLEDLSRQQDQAQQIKLAALGRLTASIAHEIRNPLSAISYATELLQEERRRDGTHERLLRIIRDNTHRLERMVQEVLELNRRDRAEPKLLDLAGFLRSFAEEFCHCEKIPAEALSLELDAPRPAAFDPTHLSQVLWNLCRNAWRHSRQQAGSVRLCAAAGHDASVIQLDVIDDGPGVDESVRHQLFEPFFTTEPQGTGLGLYIAREICEANGATLEYVDVAPGGQFRICCKGGLS